MIFLPSAAPSPGVLSLEPQMHWLRVRRSQIVPLSAAERQSGVGSRGVRYENLASVLADVSGRDRFSGARINFAPVVYTCGVSVLHDLRRTKAVLGGL
jgi:hypothetical protein